MKKIISFILIIFASFSFAQKSDKIAPAFQYLMEHPITKETEATYPELFKIESVNALDPKTGKFEKGYICIIYSKFPEVLKTNGISIQSVYPTFVTAWVTLNQIPIIANLKEVDYIEAPQILLPDNDISLASSGASLLHAGKINNTEYKGEGVIVAIVDTGIDWKHPDFRNSANPTKSRILRIWDQTLTPISGEVSPSGFIYGVEYNQSQINDEIDGSPTGTVREKDTHGHGTHVAGTAVGNGAAAAKYTGIAPNADIVVVKAGDATFSNTNIINSLSYLQNLATTLQKPIVVNMSLGGQYGAHDGTTAQELAVDAFTNSAAGRVAVIAAGNDNGKAIHKQTILTPNGAGSVAITVPLASDSSNVTVFQFSCYASDTSEITATITAPDNSTFTFNSGMNGSASIMGGVATIHYLNNILNESGDRIISFYINRLNITTEVNGIWTLSFLNMTSNTLTVDGWLNYKGLDYANTTLTSGDSNYLVTSPGTATNAITVGSYIAKLDLSLANGNMYLSTSTGQQDGISTFSSKGPRRDTIQKPDITANGQSVVSCLSSNLLTTDTYSVVNGLYTVKQGTSMASPEVAGCVALLLQINKTATFSQIKTMLTTTATKDMFTTAFNNNTWGSGKIDVFKAASSQLYCNTLDRVTYSYDAAYTNTNNIHINVEDLKVTTRFTPNTTGQLGGVYFKTGSTVTLTSFTIEVRTNEAGIPGTLLNSLVVTPSTVSKLTWNYYDLSTLNIPVTSGIDYFIVLVPGASSTLFLGQDPATVGRSFYYNGASWTAINDLRIRSVVFTTGDLNPTITLTSAAGTMSQTLCNISPITNITYSTTGATGASFSGLPSGVAGTWASNLVTISGTPTEVGNFNYSITLTGGCSVVTETGTIALLTSSIHTTTVSACDHYIWNGIDYTSSGLYTGATTNCITEKLDLTLTPFTHIWTGAVSTVWNIPTNWSCGEVPGVSSDVTIAASTNPPVISSDIVINTLTLNAGASLTVPSGFDLTVTNYIHNSGTLTVENNANLIQLDNVANTGNIIVNRNSAPIVRLDHTLWSSPVSGSQTLQQFSPNTLSNRFYNYTTSTNSYTAIPASSVFEAGKGFAIRAPNAQPTPTAAPFLGTAWSGTFTGIPNNGTITVALATDATNTFNYNLVGNPYPSAIDAKLLKESNPNMGSTLYFYQHTLTMNSSGLFDNGSTNYATWVYESTNPAGGTGVGASSGNGHSPNVTPTRTIQVGQGFIVKTSSNSMIFTNSMRSGSNNTASFMKNTTFESNRLWLNLQSGSGASISDIIVGYVTGASNDIDQGYDGLSFGNTGSFLSSKIATNNYVIQGRSLPFDSNDIVPLGFTADTAGTYSISLTNRNGIFADTQDVFLKDDLAGITHDIKASAYDFASNSGTFDARFSLIYTSALANSSTNFTPNSVVVFKPNQWFTINTNGTLMKDVLVYDMAGRLIFLQSEINANTTVLEGLSQTKGILLVKIVSNENEVVTVKVIN